MPLLALTAEPHPDGHRIDLRWAMPEGASFTGVRVVRKRGSHPRDPDDGVVVAEAEGLTAVADTDLPDNEFHYYTLFPFTGSPPVYEIDRENRVAALATAPQGFGPLLRKALPEIYHRYDQSEQLLARLLDLVGGQLDLFFSHARAQRELLRVDATYGPLLPLLGRTIGWKTDFKEELDEQREAIRNAPALYAAIGLVPTLEATIKRVSGWESRTKEYVHNVFASNRPERLNLWALREEAGDFSGPEQLVSLDHAFDGTSAYAVDGHGVRFLFHHTQRGRRIELWCKTSPAFALPEAAAALLSPGLLPPALLALAEQAGLSWSQAATAAVEGHGFRITDGADSYFVEPSGTAFTVHHTSAALDAFAPSQPVTRAEAVQKNPTAAYLDGTLWLFWEIWDEAAAQYRIRYRMRIAGSFGAVAPSEDAALGDNPFASGGSYDDAVPRRRPAAAATASQLWLFWLERAAAGWRIFYNRRDAAGWGEPVALPATGDEAFTLDDLAVVIDEDNARIHLLWAQPEATAFGERFGIRHRMKENLNLDATGWTPTVALPKGVTGDHHDREPHAHVLDDGVLELLFSSNRDDAGYSIWRSTLADPSTGTFGAAERLTAGDYSQRSPLLLVQDDERLLVYRSSRARLHESAVYRATEARDDRYAGSAFVDVRHGQRIALRDLWEDSLRYTYDTGNGGVRGDDDRIARDTVGAFVETSTLADDEIADGLGRLRPALREFVPATDRVVFVPARSLHEERVYHYGLPMTAESRFIGESVVDEWSGAVADPAFEEGEDFDDELG